MKRVILPVTNGHQYTWDNVLLQDTYKRESMAIVQRYARDQRIQRRVERLTAAAVGLVLMVCLFTFA